MNEPKVAPSLKDVRYAAGSIAFSHGDENCAPLRVLYSCNAESGCWVAECLEHWYFIESEPTTSLAEIHAEYQDALLKMLNDGDLQHFRPASEEIVAIWDQVMTKRRASTYGASVSDVLKSIVPPAPDYEVQISTKPFIHAANQDLALAA